MEDYNFLFQPKSKHLIWWINLDPPFIGVLKNHLKLDDFFFLIVSGLDAHGLKKKKKI